ncbi:MAG: MiaB/RimO family radical SAM methylthiotransferase [Phycisphaerales bacterium]|nr:MiaB/RimO family radical SAM methylthiotransferase [Phycisphaerales bacterium]
MLTYRISTLGCRVNHAEARALEQVLLDRGLRPASGPGGAHVEVIHSCAVTTRAAAKSRNAARRAARRTGGGSGPSPLVIVTGCLAADPDRARNADAAGGEANLIGHAGDATLPERFAHRVEAWLEGQSQVQTPAQKQAQTQAQEQAPARARSLRVLPMGSTAPPPAAGGHVRAEVKIQDGCDAHCTFCIIPRLRPTLRSKTIEQVVEEVRQLVDAGHVEVVLTGIFIGAWGHETALRRRQSPSSGSPLADLMDTVAQIPGLKRLRLSSMEPGDVDEPLLDAMSANDGVIVPHLHLPLQSGSDRVLRRMNRQYGADDYRDMLAMVRERLGDDVALTTDVICGFPGETPADHAATVAMALEAGFFHMHVFPYSPRPGTAAARWRDQAVDGATARQRVRALIELETRPGGLRARFQRRLLGRGLRVIIEQADAARPGRWLGRCDQYALVSIDGAHLQTGQLVQAHAEEIHDDVLLGQVHAETPAVALPQLPQGCPA